MASLISNINTEKQQLKSISNDNLLKEQNMSQKSTNDENSYFYSLINRDQIEDLKIKLNLKTNPKIIDDNSTTTTSTTTTTTGTSSNKKITKKISLKVCIIIIIKAVKFKKTKELYVALCVYMLKNDTD